jgi:hypothetical protein
MKEMNEAAHSRSTRKRWLRKTALLVASGVASEAVLIRLGQTYGSTPEEREMQLLGDEIVSAPQVVTNHAITIDAPPDCVWPWLAQMGWHRAGWYTARWVDKLLFPLNWPSASRIIPELQDIHVGDFIPDGAPETKCGFLVEELEPGRGMALHSTSHLPPSWRDKASLDWSWAFVLTPIDQGQRTRFLFRSRWVTEPWWFTLAGWLGVVPADFLMSHDMLHGVKQRAEALARNYPDAPSEGESRPLKLKKL